MDLLFVDFETFYDRKNKYDLRSISMTEYIRHTKFKVQGMGFQYNSEPTWLKEPGAFLKDNFDWSRTAVVAHNVKFDGAILSWKYGIKPQMYLDTQALARAVLGPSIDGYSLRRSAGYLGLEQKGELKTDGLAQLTVEQERTLSEYCLTDVRICKAIWDKLSPQFPQEQLWSMDWCARAFIGPKLVLDTGKLEKAVSDERIRRENAISSTGETKESLASNAKFAALVASRGYAVPTKTSHRTGKTIPAFSRTDAGLRELETLDPVLYAGRLAAKSSILETRGAKLAAISRTGPWPFDVQYSGAIQTHRYSGGSGAGGNPQNFPRVGPLRGAVRAPEGWQLVVGDFAQIEARLVAWLAQEPKLMAAFTQERDIYSEFASMVYGRTVTKQTDPKERMFGKTCILGLGYNMGWAKFQAKVKQDIGEAISEEEARRVVTLYRETYFNIPKLWKRAEALLPLLREGRRNAVPFAPFLKIGKESLVLPSGLRLLYPGLRVVSRKFRGNEFSNEWCYDHFIKRYESEQSKIYGGKLTENLCQAIAGDLCKLAIERAVKAGVDCVGQVHDEIIAVAPCGRAEEVAGTLKRCMEQSPPWLPTIRLKAEVGVGSNWSEAKNG
jgi:DNA polymerase